MVYPGNSNARESKSASSSPEIGGPDRGEPIVNGIEFGSSVRRNSTGIVSVSKTIPVLLTHSNVPNEAAWLVATELKRAVVMTNAEKMGVFIGAFLILS
jgi:hypothetical protein